MRKAPARAPPEGLDYAGMSARLGVLCVPLLPLLIATASGADQSPVAHTGAPYFWPRVSDDPPCSRASRDSEPGTNYVEQLERATWQVRRGEGVCNPSCVRVAP